jgi:hypothetical protein
MMHLCSWHNLFPSSLVLSLAYSTSSLLLSPACSLEWKLFFNDYLDDVRPLCKGKQEQAGSLS